MTALVLGATAGLGRALSRALAAEGYDIALIARDPADLSAEAAHLRCVYGVRTFEISADGAAPDLLLRAASERLRDLGRIRAVLCPIGASRPDDDGMMPLGEAERLIHVNLVSVIALVQAVLPTLLAQKSGVIVGFGSVAAARGRSSNIVYAASKRALESYFQSLRHKLSADNVRVQFYQLGYLDTRQSYGKRLPFPKASPDAIARKVAANLDRDVGLVTVPRYWRGVTLLIRLLPWPIFKRLSF